MIKPPAMRSAARDRRGRSPSGVHGGYAHRCGAICEPCSRRVLRRQHTHQFWRAIRREGSAKRARSGHGSFECRAGLGRNTNPSACPTFGTSADRTEHVRQCRERSSRTPPQRRLTGRTGRGPRPSPEPQETWLGAHHPPGRVPERARLDRLARHRTQFSKPRLCRASSQLITVAPR